MTKSLLLLLGSLILISCGDGDYHQSYTKDVTAPDEQVVGTAREFWFFESPADGLGKSTFKLEDTNVSYFPEAFPVEDDFFWTVTNGSDTLSRVEFGLSWDSEIQRAVPQFNKLDLKGNIFSISMLSDSLARVVWNRSWQIDFQPVFRVRSKGQEIPLQLKFTIRNVCFNPRFFTAPVSNNLDGMVIEDFSIEKSFAKSLNTASPELSPTIQYRPNLIKEFLDRCRIKGGDVASSLELDLDGETKGSDLEFSGIKTNMVIYDAN